MSNPIPLTTDGTGPKGAVPVEIHGGLDSGPVEVADVVGLQNLLDTLTQRIEALELVLVEK